MDMAGVTVAVGRALGGTPGLEVTARRATGDKLLRAKLSRRGTPTIFDPTRVSVNISP